MSRNLPKKSLSDNFHLAARVALSSIPAAGGPLVELFNSVIGPPLQNRRDAWLTELAERVSTLEQRGLLKIADLAKSEEFISTVIQASTAALRTHHEQKIEALRNAVINTALGLSLEDTKREMFLAFVDQFSVCHLKVLDELSKTRPTGSGREKVELTIERIAEVAMEKVPALRGETALAETVVEDLCRKGLVFWNRGAVVNLKWDARQVTELGMSFLKFIREPENDG